nr:recombinase RecT [Streptococcus anginosus]
QFFNTSDDNDLFIGAVNRTTENEYDNEHRVKDITPQETESLDDVLGNPTVSESESVENPQETADTPKVDEETGEVLDGEQGELFKELEDLM